MSLEFLHEAMKIASMLQQKMQTMAVDSNEKLKHSPVKNSIHSPSVCPNVYLGGWPSEGISVWDNEADRDKYFFISDQCELEKMLTGCQHRELGLLPDGELMY